MIGIYKIINKVNNKIYIGQSCDCHRRWMEHLRSGQPDKYAIKSQRDLNAPIHLAMQKYGIENFEIKILEICEREKLNEKEKDWIKFYKQQGYSLYNITDGGQKNGVSLKGEKHSQAKLTQAEVNEIKRLLKDTKKSYNEILALFPNITSKSIISLINQGKNWFDEKETYPIRQTDYRNIGEKAGGALFTNEEVMNIRKEYAENPKLSATILANKYSVSINTMSAILQGRSYKYLPYYKKSLKKWIEPCIDYPQSLK